LSVPANVVPPSEIDPATVGTLDEALRRCDPAGETVVDFTDVTFCDSSGLRVLIEHATRHADAGGALTLVGVSAAVRRVFEITGTDAMFGLAERDA
jgi:anti-sigma B factor antagonist